MKSLPGIDEDPYELEETYEKQYKMITPDIILHSFRAKEHYEEEQQVVDD